MLWEANCCHLVAVSQEKDKFVLRFTELDSLLECDLALYFRWLHTVIAMVTIFRVGLVGG